MSDRPEAPQSPNEPEGPDPRPVPPDVASDNKEGIAPVAPSELAPPARASRAMPPDLARAAEAAPVPGVPSRDPKRSNPLAEPPEIAIEVPRRRLAAQSRRDFLLFAAGVAASAAGAWWLLPDRAKARCCRRGRATRLDTLAARVGLSRAIGASASSIDRSRSTTTSPRRSTRRTAACAPTGRSEVTRLPNNYHGRTPGEAMPATWSLNVSGLAAGGAVALRSTIC